MLEPQALEALAPGRAAVGVGVDDQLGAAAQRLVAGRVHVAEDHVRLQPRLEDRVGAAVDADEQRPHVADVGAQRAQVLAVGRSPRTTISTWRSRNAVAGRRELDAAGEQLALLADVRRSCSRRTRRAPRRSARAARESCSASSSASEHAARRERPSRCGEPRRRRPSPGRRPAAPRRAAPRARRSAAPRPARAQRAGVRIAAGRGRRDVDHRPHPGRDQVLGGDPVEVGVVDRSRCHRRRRRLTRSLVLRPSRALPWMDVIGARAGRGRCASAGRAREIGRAWPSDAPDYPRNGGTRKHRLEAASRARSPASPAAPAGSGGREQLAGVAARGLVVALGRRACGRSRRPARRRPTRSTVAAPGRREAPSRSGSAPRPGRRPAAGG